MKVERDGLGFRAEVVDQGVSLAVDRISEARGDTYGELSVSMAPEGHLMRTRIPLTSGAARASMARVLNGRVKNVNWIAVLEEFCVGALELLREGAPIVRLGQKPSRRSVDFLVEPILPINKPTILFGSEGTGKSTLTAAIAVAVASGKTTFSGWTVREPRNVLVLDWEADEDDWNDLIWGVSRGIGIDPPANIVYRDGLGPLTHQVNEIARVIDEEEIGLMIVDSVGLANPGGRDGSDANTSAIQLFGALRLLGTTKLLIDHVPKNEDGSARPYGSVYKPALARAVYELRGSEDVDEDGSRHLALFHRKGNQTARQKPVGIRVIKTDEEVLLIWEPPNLNDEKIAKGATLTDRIQSLLRPGPLTVAQIAEETDSTPNVIRKILSRYDTLFVAINQSGEKANVWALRSNRDSVARHVAPATRDTLRPPKGGLSGSVSQVSRPFDALAEMNERRGA